MREIHPRRFDFFARHATARKVFLDLSGKALTSEGVVALAGKAELEAWDVVFLIGGHDGLPAEWRAKSRSVAIALGDDDAVASRQGA